MARGSSATGATVIREPRPSLPTHRDIATIRKRNDEGYIALCTVGPRSRLRCRRRSEAPRLQSADRDGASR